MKLSVCITTYNQESYIAQAIDSAMMQEADFDYELIIGEDDSSDKTREIVKRYKKKYPQKIKLFLNDRKNVIYINGQPTGRWNFINNLQNARGEYIALLDGDDYWTDPHKLQRQVDFLDAHPEYASCFHPVDWLVQETGENIKAAYGPPFIADYYGTDDLLRHSNFIPTCSAVFRRHLAVPVPAWFSEMPIADFPLHLILSTKGKIGFINESMAVYRHHKDGLYGGKNKKEQCRILISTLHLVGTKLKLKKKLSWQMGISTAYTELCEAYKDKGEFWRALKAGCAGLRYAPHHLISHIPPKMASAVSAFFGPACSLVERFVSIARHNGMKAIIKKSIHRLTGHKA